MLPIANYCNIFEYSLFYYTLYLYPYQLSLSIIIIDSFFTVKHLRSFRGLSGSPTPLYIEPELEDGFL